MRNSEEEPEKPVKSRGDISNQFNEMKNYDSLSLTNLSFEDMVVIGGGELPYTENAINGRAVADTVLTIAHNTSDFFRGFVRGLMG
jgi:hypothetical protein